MALEPGEVEPAHVNSLTARGSTSTLIPSVCQNSAEVRTEERTRLSNEIGFAGGGVVVGMATDVPKAGASCGAAAVPTTVVAQPGSSSAAAASMAAGARKGAFTCSDYSGGLFASELAPPPQRQKLMHRLGHSLLILH